MFDFSRFCLNKYLPEILTKNEQCDINMLEKSNLD